MVTVLCGGKVLKMTPEEARRRGVLGGPAWDAEHDEHETLKTHRAVINEMDMDGRVFHSKIGGRSRAIEAESSGDETTFAELFEQQEYWV